jgi:hypothetical protein
MKMGWWNVSENPEIVTGDAVLDTARHFLRDFSREFQEDLSRKPTLQELEYALNLAFRANLDNEILAGFDELEVKQISIKTVRRSKRQKANPGDIFAFRLDDWRFGFGRIIRNVSIGSIAEIFDYFSDQPIFDHSVEKKWLIPPIPIDSYLLLEAKKMGDWRIIESDPTFVPGEKFSSLRYVYGTPPHALIETDIYENERPISENDAKALPEYYGHNDFHVKQLLSEHIKSS